ncbi:SLAP domain-containing protein, partial [Lactobacillus bombicola]
AEDELNQKHQNAIDQIHKEFGDQANTSNTDKGFNDHKQITGDNEQEINANKLAAEKEIAKGAVEDVATNAKNKVDSLKHKDGSDYTTNEKEAIKDKINQIVTEGKDKIDNSKTTGEVDTNRDAAIDQIIQDSIQDSDAAKEIWNKDPKVQNDQAKQKAEDELNQKHQDAIDQIHKEFGDQADTSKTDKGFNDHKQITGDSEEEINANKLAAEKEIAKGAVEDVATNAKKKVDSLKHKDGSDYTTNEKQAIKDKIDQIVTEGKGKIDKSTTTDEVDTNRDAAINQIIKDSTQDSDAAKDIWNNDPKVQNDRNHHDSGNIPSVPGTPGTPNDTANKPNSSDSEPGHNSSSKDNDHGVDVTLMHNAYLYDQTGSRCNKVILGAGSVVTTYGVTTINGRQFYILHDQNAANKQYYLALGNVKYRVQKLVHNAAVYDQYGRRINSAGLLRKDRLINTYGSAVTIRGSLYFIIAKNRYVKASNVMLKKIVTETQAEEVEPINTSTADAAVAVNEKQIMHNAYVYDEKGTRSNQLIFKAGSIVNTVGTKTINNRLFYVLENGMYIAAGNIDAKKLRLKHNAYLYSQYGNRLNHSVVRKYKLVRTYGSPVRIKNGTYYIVAKNKNIKEANFITK